MVGNLKPEIATGLPPSVKDRPRADFNPTEYDQAILSKGYDLWWSRSAPCPCSNNVQTEQPNILCTLCKGTGFYLFLPEPTVIAGGTKDRYGNEVVVSPDGKAISIKAIMTSMTQDVQVFEKFGEWVFGTSRVTTQAGNRLGYRDRLTAMKSEMVYAQHIDYAGGDVIAVVGDRNKQGLRYPMVRVHDFRSVDTVYRENRDWILTVDGEIQWHPAFTARPATGTRLVVHGTVRPVWIVMDIVHAYRDTQVEGGKGIPSQKFTILPVQAVVKLEYLVNAE